MPSAVFLYCFFGFNDWLVFLGAVLYIRSVSRLLAAVLCRVMPVFWCCLLSLEWMFRKAVFYGFSHRKEHFCTENEEKMRFFQKKSGKCFVVKKKAIPLHSLYNGNSATNDDRLFSSVGQST